MTCANCGNPLTPGVRYCGHCGAPAPAGAAQAAPAAPMQRGSRVPMLVGAVAAAAIGVIAALWATGNLPGGGSDAPAAPAATESFAPPATLEPPTLEPPTAAPAEPTAAPAEPTAAPTEAPTAAPTLVPPPTAPPVPTATPAPTAAPVSVEFYPDNGQFVIPEGQLCTALNWRTTGVTEVALQREGGERVPVEPSGRQTDICFGDDEMLYTLFFKLPDGREDQRTVRLERE